MKKKERIYAKDKTIRVRNNKNNDGTFSSYNEALLNILSLDETLWGRFAIDVFTNNKEIDILPENNVKNIFYELPNEQLRTIVFNNLFSIKDYNPYNDEFPITKINTQYQNIILKKQKYIKENYQYRKLLKEKNYTICCQYNKNNNELKHLLEIFDIVFLFNSHSFLIATKEKIDLMPIYEFLNGFEKDKWVIDDKKKRIFLKKNKKTQIDIRYKIKDIIELLPTKKELIT